MQIINFIRERISALIREEDAQDGIEYLLVIGGVSVAVVIAAALLATNGAPGVVSGVCTAISKIPHMSSVSC